MAETPLHLAAKSGDMDKVRELLEGGKYGVNCFDLGRWTPLHMAAYCGHLGVVKVLISEFKANVNACTDSGETPLHQAASNGHSGVVRVLISEFKSDVNTPTNSGETPLHKAARQNHLDVVRVLISEFKADVNTHTSDNGDMPLHLAAYSGHLDMIRVLVSEFKADVNACTDSGETPLHQAASNGHSGVVTVLVSEFRADVNTPTNSGETPLHKAARQNHLDVVRVLISDFKADVNTHTNNNGDMPLHLAAYSGHLDMIRVLVSEFKVDVNACTDSGETTLHKAASWNNLSVIRVLVSEFKADVNARTANYGETPLHLAARRGYLDVVRVLVSEFKADVNACTSNYGETPLHQAAYRGHMDMVRMLISEFKADVSACTSSGCTPFDEAVNNYNDKVAVVLMNEFHYDTKGGTPYIHTACEKGLVNLVQALIQKHGTGVVTARDDEGNTPLHLAIVSGRAVKTLICDGKADVTARDDKGNTPLHVAALLGREDAVKLLINEFGCDINVIGSLGRSLLHSACASNNVSLVRFVSQHISPWVVDDNGDTPLHICARLGYTESVEALLELDPPVMIRNKVGQSPRDLERTHYGQSPRDLERTHYACGYIDVYMKRNKGKIYSQYEVVQKHAKKKYSRPEPITRAFVIGYPGAGKSSLVEALKREGVFAGLWRVSESSVPPRTAGIVPSIHTSKHYGRVLFYDFAGDAEYYSSHAAILENLASSRKGDNVFLLVIDMREEMAEIKRIFHYWLSFIQHQQFQGQQPSLIVVGSHLDLLAGGVAKTRGKEFQVFYDSIGMEAVQMSALFMLDCRKPRSKHIAGIQTLMSRLTKDSPRYKLSLQASTLLGLLEKDFSSVPACSIQALLSHIEETGLQLLAKEQSLHQILLELHDLGLLFVIDSSNRESSSVVLNMSQLTNIVHKSLFSEEAVLKASFEKEGLSFSFSAGIIPLNILAKVLPENVTKECLVQLQYCQEISHAEAHVFPSLKVTDSTDQSFLFFPALCSADKSEVEWVTPPDLSYGIGWLARCIDPCDYLSPRFHHVLMLRLVFKFTLSAHPPADQVSSGSSDLSHFQRRCTVWKTGVHWLMEEGVECMVELAGANREVVVLTKSIKDRAENCAVVFNDIVTCVMEAKAEFCHSVRLEFFLLDSTSEADYHSADNLFAMRDVEEVLTTADGRAKVVVSASGKRQMERSKLLCLRNFTLWYSLFPMDIDRILHYIKDIVEELYMLSLNLNIPKSTFDELESRYFTEDPEKMRRELVKGWMSSSLEPPCWLHLVNALLAISWTVLAEEIATEFGKL